MTTATNDLTAIPLEMRFDSQQKQNRWTVFFRGILLIPQAIVLVFVSIAALVVAIIGWFAALFTGRLPAPLAEFLAGYVRWTARVDGYAHFLTGKYPPFSMQPSEEYPIDIVVQGGRLNRWAVLFRIILAVPAYIVSTVSYFGLTIFSIILWFAALFTAGLPPAFFDATAATIRYRTRYNGYFLLLTSVYAGGLLGDQSGPAAVSPAAYAAPVAPPVEPPVVAPPVEPPAPPASESPAVEGAVPSAPPFAGVSAPLPPPPPFPPTAPPMAPPVAPAWMPESDPTAAGGSVSPWQLVLSQRGRALVIIYIVLGALAYVGQGVSHSGTHHNNQAQSSIVAPAGAVGVDHIVQTP